MLMRSGFFTRPSPLVELDCGSQSTSSVLTSAAASEAARLMAVVVLPTPPFWLATAMMRPMILFSWCLRVRICERIGEINADCCAKRDSVPRGTLSSFPTDSALRSGDVFPVKHIEGELPSAKKREVFHVEHQFAGNLLMR